jgi:hypothetical protein
MNRRLVEKFFRTNFDRRIMVKIYS